MRWPSASNALATARRGVRQTSAFLGRFRWAFVPLGLLALIACGVHAAADAVDDRILWVVDGVDAAFDALFSRLPFTHGLVNLIGLEQRLWVSRSLALLWELAADLILGFPALGYRERQVPRRPWAEQGAALKAMAERMVRHPTTLRLVRPLATLAVVIAGACAVAKGVQTSLFGALHGVLGFGLSASLAKLLAVGALFAVLASLGGRAVVRNAEHADLLSERAKLTAWDLPFLRGLWASIVVGPLAIVALWDASPVLSFFR